MAQLVTQVESRAGSVTPRPAASLRTLAIRGSAWTIAGYGASQVLRLGSNLVLTRLLFPEAFGLMALVYLLVQGLNMFSDVGIQPSIVQNERGNDPTFLNTAWTIQIIRGFALWICVCMLAWPFATFYGDMQLAWFALVAGFSAVIAGFNSTALASAHRHLALGRLTVLDLIAQIVSLVVMLIWAWFFPTVWALVAGGLVASGVKMILSHAWLGEIRNRFAWDRQAGLALLSFGKWIFLSSAVTFLAMQADRLILGKLLTLEMLGVYSIAYMLIGAPRQVLSRIGSSVMFPAVSRRAHLDREELRRKIIRQRWWPLLGMAGVVALLATLGDQVVLVLWDDRYAAASWMTVVLALGLWPTVLNHTLAPALMAVGRPQYIAMGNLVRLLWVSILMIVGFFLFGLLGALVVVASGDIPKYLSTLLGLRRERMLAWKQDVLVTAILVGLLIAGLVLRKSMGIPDLLQTIL